MKQKKSLVMAAWLLVAVVFAGLLGFLLVAASGLDIDVQQTDSFDKLAVVVSNKSKHVINFVSVIEQGTETKALGILQSLKPGENKTFFIPVQESRIRVMALAPFHATASKDLFLDRPKPFTIEISKPDSIALGKTFELPLQICNQTKETNISVGETHEISFFGTNYQTKQISIPTKECKNASFVFTPSFAGSTRINFNIKNDSFSETFETEIFVKS